MKKFLLLLVSIVLTISFVSCSKSSSKTESIKSTTISKNVYKNEIIKIQCDLNKKYAGKKFGIVMIKQQREMLSRVEKLNPDSSVKKVHYKLITLLKDEIKLLAAEKYKKFLELSYDYVDITDELGIEGFDCNK